MRVRIAKGGQDVYAGANNLIFDSNYSTLNVYKDSHSNGFLNVPADGVVSVFHGLGYSPQIDGFVKQGAWWYPAFAGIQYLKMWTDTNNAYFKMVGGSGYYKVFYNIFGNTPDNATGSGKNTATGNLRIAKAGKNIDITSDLRDMALDTGVNVLKRDVNMSQSASYIGDANGSSVSLTFNHNYGYPPIVYGIVSDSNFAGNMLLPFASVMSVYEFKVNSTQIIFTMENWEENSSGNLTVHFMLFKDKLE